MQGRTSMRDIKAVHTLTSDILSQHCQVPIMRLEDIIKWVRDIWYNVGIHCIPYN